MRASCGCKCFDYRPQSIDNCFVPNSDATRLLIGGGANDIGLYSAWDGDPWQSRYLKTGDGRRIHVIRLVRRMGYGYFVVTEVEGVVEEDGNNMNKVRCFWLSPDSKIPGKYNIVKRIVTHADDLDYRTCWDNAMWISDSHGFLSMNNTYRTETTETHDGGQTWIPISYHDGSTGHYVYLPGLKGPVSSIGTTVKGFADGSFSRSPAFYSRVLSDITVRQGYRHTWAVTNDDESGFKAAAELYEYPGYGGTGGHGIGTWIVWPDARPGRSSCKVLVSGNPHTRFEDAPGPPYTRYTDSPENTYWEDWTPLPPSIFAPGLETTIFTASAVSDHPFSLGWMYLYGDGRLYQSTNGIDGYWTLMGDMRDNGIEPPDDPIPQLRTGFGGVTLIAQGGTRSGIYQYTGSLGWRKICLSDPIDDLSSL